MAEKDTINNQEAEAENSDSWENLSNDEWTIVDKNSFDKDNTDAHDDITEEQESFRSVEIIATSSDIDTNETRMGISILKNHEEDSDGISVITESEAEPLVADKKFGQIDGCKNHVLGALRMCEKTGEKTAPQVGAILNVVIACSLAAIIGLGAGRILGMDEKCPVSNSVDFSTIKIEGGNLVDRIKELSEVKNVLDEIKASIPQSRRAEEKISQSESKSRSKRSERREKRSKISETYIFDPDTTILEQLQNSLNTLCSVIDGMNPDDDFIKSDTLRTQGVVSDLIEFKKIIFTVIKELEDTSGPKEMEFLRHAEQRIRHVCESLLNDLSYTVHGLTMKIHHKLNKVRRKLNKKLCTLKTSSESIDDRIFESLEENNSFLESCDKILNVTFKPNQKSEKKEESNEKIYPKKTNNLKTRLKINSISDSEDETYPSDSSMPDLTYDDHDYNNNIWKKTEILRQRSEENCGKIILENDANCRRIKNSNPMKSSRDRSLKKLFMEVLVPAKACSLSQERYMELKFVYPEIQHLETSILNEKPLYSTILKSNNDKSLTKDKFYEQKFSEKEISDDAEARERITDQESVNLEISDDKEKDKDLTETKHDVTPSGSGINIETIKNMKERWNTKIREPVGEYRKDQQDKENVPQSEEIISKKPKADSERSKLKYCRQGKKCFSNNDSTKSDELDKGSADSSTNFGDHDKPKRSKKEKAAKKKPERDENYEKRIKKGKNGKKIPAEPLKSEKILRKRNDNKKINDQLTGDWQLQRSRAREIHRDHNHRSEWFFNRADYRQDARKNMDEIPSAKSGAGLSGYQSCKSYRKDYKCEPVFEERINDEDFPDYRNEAKHINDQKHSNSRAGFTSKKNIKMLRHRNNIMQSKRR